MYRKSEDNPYKCGRSQLASAQPEPGDELQDAYTYAELLRMDAAFCGAMEQAIRRGLERRPQEGRQRAA
jgi:hypothetical protein